MDGLPWWLSGNKYTYQWRRPELDPWVRKTPWRRAWQPTPVFLPGESDGQRSLADYSPWNKKRVEPVATKQQHLMDTGLTNLTVSTFFAWVDRKLRTQITAHFWLMWRTCVHLSLSSLHFSLHLCWHVYSCSLLYPRNSCFTPWLWNQSCGEGLEGILGQS